MGPWRPASGLPPAARHGLQVVSCLLAAEGERMRDTCEAARPSQLAIRAALTLDALWQLNLKRGLGCQPLL